MKTQSIFITGAASGIGQATARLFHQRGWSVGLVDVNEDELKTLANELGETRSWYAVLDVRDAQAVTQALADFTKMHH